MYEAPDCDFLWYEILCKRWPGDKCTAGICKEKGIVTKTLAVKDREAHHTSELLQVFLENLRQDFDSV